jgi:TonB family protein
MFERPRAAAPSISGWSDVGTSRTPGRLGSRGAPIALSVIAIILVSLAAGWASGHGVFNRILQKIPSITWYHNAADPDAMPRSAGRIAQISQIEIVDGNNQQWAISFNGPMSAFPPSPRWQNSGRASIPVSPLQIPFQTWVLSAPVRSSGDTAGNGQDEENAPVLPNGAENASSTSLGLPAPSSLTSPQPAPPAQQRGADLRPGDLILRVEPVYPAIAKEHGIGGTVKLRVTVGPDGIVRGLELVSGPQVLVGAARTAVLQWRYAPTTLDGKAIETEKEITLVFQSPQP